jgi:hypothetical protein
LIDSKAKRSAALGFGLSFLLVLPPADGSISIENAGHALNAYEFDLPGLSHLVICDTTVESLNPIRLVVSLTPERDVDPLGPIRTVTRYCP